MHVLDYIVLGFYLLGTLAVGIFFSSKNKSSEDMFSAGGESPWWTSGLSAYMTMFSAGTFVVWGGIAYGQGAVAIAINCCYGIAALVVGYFVAAKWKALGVGTPAEFIEVRFGQSVVTFYTWAMMIFRIVGTGVALYALAIILVSMMPMSGDSVFADAKTGHFSVMWAILIFGGIVVLYTMIGGLWAVLMTDVLQFIILTLAVFILLPLIWGAAGGWNAFVDAVPDTFLSPVSEQYSWFFLLGWVFIHIFMIGAEWAFAQRFISVSSPENAKKSAYLFGVLYLISPALWMLPPMMYRAINPDANAEQAYMLAGAEVLPVGMIGLMVAAMFSATASLVSSQLNVFAGVLTEITAKYFKGKGSGASGQQQVKLGRTYTVILGGVIVVIALMVPHLGGAEKIIVGITSLLVGPLMAPTLFGLLGRKIDSRSLWTTVAICFVTSVSVKYGVTNQWLQSNAAGVENLAVWVASFGKNTDIMLGVFLPLIILTAFQVLRKEDAEGAIKVDSLRLSYGNKPQKSSSALPAKVVCVALACCSLLFFVVAVFAEQQQGLLIVFASLVGTIAAAIALVLKVRLDSVLKAGETL